MPSGRTTPADAIASLRIVRGALATETLLLEEVARLVAAARDDLSLLATPVRIVVSSRTLRDHVAWRVLQRCGGSAAGVVVQTLQALGRELLQRSGVRRGDGDVLLPLLVRRFAADDPVLREALEGLDDGYGAAIPVVSDLLDAGLVEAHAGAIDDLLDDRARLAATEAEAPRARALVRLALRVAATLDAMGLAHRAQRLVLAREALERGGDDVLPARAVHVHGFADATGVALDLIEALTRQRGAVVWLEQPPDPAGDGAAASEPSRRFSRRLAERLGAVRGVERLDGVPSPPKLVAQVAAGADAEVRGVARRIRALVVGEGGPPVPAERILLVSRNPAPYAVALRRHLGRLGIPFSSPSPAPPDASVRRMNALIRVLREGESVPQDVWLEAARFDDRSDLQVALHALGLGRLRDVAELDVSRALGGRDAFALPVRCGLATATSGREGDEAETDDPEPSPEPEVRSPRRQVRAATLGRASARAEALRRVLRAAAAPAALTDQLAHLRAALSGPLGLVPSREDPGEDARGDDPGAVLLRALRGIELELPGSFELRGDELVTLLERHLHSVAAGLFGGAGAGVRVLDVVAARGLTADHLFVLGLQRDVFPRIVTEEPLICDGLRRALRDVLPDLPLKETGYDEEGHLFAQLLSASPHVCLSWQEIGDDGKPRSPSPLLERLRWAGRIGADEKQPGLRDVRAAAGPGVRGPCTAAEHALVAALQGGRAALAPLLPLALAEAADRAAAPSPADDALAAVRLGALAELDRPPHPRVALGPFDGFVGRCVEAADPRAGALFVTTAERHARCGWQTFVERFLRLEPPPDALGALPALDRLLVGAATHGALEAIARRSGAGAASWSDVISRPGAPWSWPADDDLASIAEHAAEEVLRDEGVALPGLARALSRLVLPKLALARVALAGGARLLGAEVQGVCAIVDRPGREIRLRFVADAIERDADGALVVTDYKTGKPLSKVGDRDKRERDFLKQVRAGTMLQAVAYALAAADGAAAPTTGRYLYLDEAGGEPASFAVRSDAAPFVAAFGDATRGILDAVASGSFTPRLVDGEGEEPGACSRCRVAETCLRGDSGARGRLDAWLRARAAGPVADDAPAERALLALWNLGQGTPA
jgi:hypothetical protein